VAVGNYFNVTVGNYVNVVVGDDTLRR